MSITSKLIIFLFSFFLLYSPIINSDDDNILSYEYNFKWGLIPIANLIMTYDAKYKREKQSEKLFLEFFVETKGPLKLIKDYSVSGGIKRYSEDQWEYYLHGYDRGVLEEKSIIFGNKKKPIVRLFTDDKGLEPIDPINNKQIDPITSFLTLAESVMQDNKCVSNNMVYDGKRNLNIQTYKSKDNKGGIIKSINYEVTEVLDCIMRVDMSLINNDSSKKWPFGKNLRYVWFSFSKTGDIAPIAIKLEGPFGDIVGHRKY